MSKNVNCLRGIACPMCGQNDRFYITGMSSFEVTDDGAEQIGDIEWDGDSYCSCPDCRNAGLLRDFKRKRAARKKPVGAVGSKEAL